MVVDARGVPFPRRRTFAIAAARRWSPFPDAAVHVEWAGDQAMAWTWPFALQRGVDARPPRRTVPETLFRGAPRDEGAEVVAMSEGVEGRVWRGGMLQACLWWPRPPSLAEWNTMLRGAGFEAVDAVPAPVEAALAPAAWVREKPRALVEVSRHRRLLLPALGAAGVFAFAFMLGSLARLAGERARLEGAIGIQQELVADILAAREAAEQDAGAIDALLALRPPAGQVRVLAALVAALPPGWTLLEWRSPDPSKLEAVVSVSNPDPRALVTVLEAQPWLRDVTVEVGQRPQELTIRASIDSGAKPAVAAGDAS